jgi:hypothetical protein
LSKGQNPRILFGSAISHLLRHLTLRLIRRIIDLRLKTLQQPLKKSICIRPFILQLMRMGNMPSQICEHNPPRKRILPGPTPDTYMLPLLRNPYPKHLKGSFISLRSRRNTQNLLNTHG